MFVDMNMTIASRAAPAADHQEPSMRTDSTLTVATSYGAIPVTISARGSGRPVLLLHGGAGPASVSGFADLLAEGTRTRVITPTHPGFGGTPRPPALETVAGLADLYACLLDVLDLDDVTVIGNSLGGWIAAELALRHSPRVGRIAIVDAVGIEVPGHPVADFFALTPAQIAEHSYYDPSKAVIPDPTTLPPAARQIALGNREALATYGGTMADAGLSARLGSIDVPALVLWGEADRIADPDYGRAYAAAIPGARFVLLEHTGHVPQVETPQALLDAVRDLVA
jgi:pimeloyl-ACP methyl ester carboxylesterase